MVNHAEGHGERGTGRAAAPRPGIRCDPERVITHRRRPGIIRTRIVGKQSVRDLILDLSTDLGTGQGQHHAARGGRVHIGPDVQVAGWQGGQVQDNARRERLDVVVGTGINQRQAGVITIGVEANFFGCGQAPGIGYGE